MVEVVTRVEEEEVIRVSLTKRATKLGSAHLASGSPELRPRNWLKD